MAARIRRYRRMIAPALAILLLPAVAAVLWPLTPPRPRLTWNPGPGLAPECFSPDSKTLVLTADPGREFSFATEEGGQEGVEWRYRIEAVEGGTRVTESYEIHRIPTWARIVDVPTNRAGELRRHMQQTLEQLKRAAEAAPQSQ